VPQRSTPSPHRAGWLFLPLLALGCASFSSEGEPARPQSPPMTDAGTEASTRQTDAEAGARSLLGCGGDTSCRVVFITSTPFGGGDVGNLAGGDAKCNEAAGESALASVRGRSFKAWLSGASSGDAVDRISQTSSTKRFVRPDGAIIANNVADLIDGSLRAPIDLDENGSTVNDVETWTGTLANGRRADDEGISGKGTCESWTSSAAQGMTGRSNRLDGSWTNDNYFVVCSGVHHLYCFEN
jgi:hypothetical protein